MNPAQSAHEDAPNILNTVQEAYLRLDGELRFTFVNRTAELLLGAPQADLIGKTPWEVHPETAGTPLEEGFRRAKAENAVVSFENYYDPWKRWYSITAIPDSSGGFVVHFSDITERRAAEARLQAQNERFQRIIENTDAGYFRIGMDGCYEDVNPAWLRMHGFANREEAIGLHFSAVQVPEDLSNAAGVVDALVGGESPKSGEFFRLRRDGSIGYHTFSANPVLEGDRVVGLEGFLVDITDRRIAEVEREHTEQRYRSLFNSMQEGVAIHKLIRSNSSPENYILLEVNRRYEKILGVRREDVVNKVATEAYGTHGAPYLREYASVVETGIPLQLETYFAPMDKHFVISVAPMGDDRFATIFFDITEQKRNQEAAQQAKEAVARAERHYRLMFNSVSDAVFIHRFGEDGLPSPFLEVNDNACGLLGYAREELMQMRVVDIIAPEENFNAPANAKRLLADGHATWEGRLAAEDGRLIPVEVNARVFNLDGSPTIISSVRDISERKQAEEALRESEERHRSIVQTAMEGFWLTNSEGRLLEVNETYCRMSGYSTEELLTMCISDLVDNETADETAIRIKSLISQGEARFESRHRRKDGSTFAVEAGVQYRPVAGGRFVCFLRDITERRRVEAEKTRLEDQLRQAQKLESVGRLAGGVAHDFNNLLTVINGYSGMLLEQLKVFDPLHPYALEIKNAGERAASLTKQLLALSRKQVIEPRVFDLNTTIRQSAPMLQRLIGEDIVLETHLDDLLGQVLADPDQIHQVIMNLAVNARDAMPDGGMLRIATTNREVGAEASTAEHPDAVLGRYVLMTVTDSGHGMDEMTRQRIFEPFFTTKEVGKGTGLGLATVHGIIRQSGGWVEVSSEVGVGTSFEVYLPRLDGCSLPEESRIGVVTERGNETILLVEDQQSVRSFTRAALKASGYHVIEAPNGDEAISVAERYAGEIHLLLTDVVMPGISGKESSERLKKLRPNLKVLFMSGYTADVIAQRGVLDRSVAFLHKPFSPVELAVKVREVLAQSS